MLMLLTGQSRDHQHSVHFHFDMFYSTLQPQELLQIQVHGGQLILYLSVPLKSIHGSVERHVDDKHFLRSLTALSTSYQQELIKKILSNKLTQRSSIAEQKGAQRMKI